VGAHGPASSDRWGPAGSALPPAGRVRRRACAAHRRVRRSDELPGLCRVYAGTLDSKTIAITFDDGFKDLENAVAILSDAGFSATAFVSTSVIDGTETYRWARHAAPVLSWDEIRALELGQTLKFEPHSLTHRDLTRLDAAECDREIRGSKSAVEAELNREATVFSYPFGFVGERERKLVELAGFAYGVSCEPGLNTRATDPFLIRRIQIDRTDRLRDFVAKVQGSHDRPLPARFVYRRVRYGVRTPPVQHREHGKRARLVVGRPPRALVVSSFVLPHVGGVEQFVAFTTEDLREAGWTVTVAASTPPDGGPAQADMLMPTAYFLASGHPVAYSGWLRLWKAIGEADIVISNQHRNLLPVVAVLGASIRRRPSVFVIHTGTGIPSHQGWWLNRLSEAFEQSLVRVALHRCTMVASLSSSGREFVKATWKLDSPYVPFPIRLLPKVPPKRLERGEPLRAVWVGRFYPQKDPELAVRAVENARESCNVVLEMYGAGILRPEIERLARDRPWLEVHGERTWEEVQELQASSHFCLLSSRNEATCLAALEPLSRGVPIVATDVGDIRQHLGPELEEFAVEPNNAQALADAIVYLSSSYASASKRFAANGDRLREHHSDGPETLVALVNAMVIGDADPPNGTPGRVAENGDLEGLTPSPAGLET
jgi:glycosyltransferase involved in cell wall biosynthesis/peptidoglycan/xylan/chitin deacetylase (PgdA/CDA1 family)